MQPKRDYQKIRRDFEAMLDFVPANQGGLQNNFVFQGFRVDFAYEDDLRNQFMIWHIYVDDDGAPYPDGTQVFTDRPVRVHMYIVNDELRHSLHGKRIKAGTKFFVMSGGQKLASGVVIKILSLHDKDL